jgi:hypothetical protein
MTGGRLDTHLNHFLNELNRNKNLNLPSHLIEMTHVFAPVISAPIPPFAAKLNLWMKP